MKIPFALGLGLLAATPAVFAQAYGAGVSLLPNEAFLVVHFIAFLLGLFLFRKAWKWQGGLKNLSVLFLFFAIAELIYVATHAGGVDLYFAHQAGETLLFIGALVSVWGVMKKK